MPKISVLMPVYNGEKFLRQAIDSVINQSYSDWELIIIDDGSVDGSSHIIQSYSDTRIRYFRNVENIGLINSLNKGLNLCAGQYIARMDADDISEVDRFALQLDFLENNTSYAVCGSWARVIDENNTIIGNILNFCDPQYLKINLLFSVPFVHPSMMIRSQVLKKFRFDSLYQLAEDYDLWCRIADTCQVANIPSFLLKYRWHNHNVSVVNAKVQQDVKNKIIERQLRKMNLEASAQELYLHNVSFMQNDAKEKRHRETFDDFDGLNNWYAKIVAANQVCSIYDSESLKAYLWSRWIILCITQKKIGKIFRPTFITVSLQTIMKTAKLILFFSKK